MPKQHKNIFEWNHISDKLNQTQIQELKEYYQTYHKKCWAYKQGVKRFKKWKLLGNSISIIFASGSIASSIATGGISLVAISTIALLIQGWMQHQNLDLKIQNCIYATQSYIHILNTLKFILRTGEFDLSNILITMKNTDDYISDNSPIIDRYLLKYDKKFTV